jgi:hypothetical protein
MDVLSHATKRARSPTGVALDASLDYVGADEIACVLCLQPLFTPVPMLIKAHANPCVEAWACWVGSDVAGPTRLVQHRGLYHRPTIPALKKPLEDNLAARCRSRHGMNPRVRWELPPVSAQLVFAADEAAAVDWLRRLCEELCQEQHIATMIAAVPDEHYDDAFSVLEWFASKGFDSRKLQLTRLSAVPGKLPSRLPGPNAIQVGDVCPFHAGKLNALGNPQACMRQAALECLRSLEAKRRIADDEEVSQAGSDAPSEWFEDTAKASHAIT